MKILIIEDDLALARSISYNLHDLGHFCEIISSISEENKEPYDVILVSSRVCTQGRCEHFVRYNSKQIIIMMASHVNEDGVNKPIQAGARDYILKPFKMDELLRKIQYHKAYQEMTARLGFYENYLDFIHAELPLPKDFLTGRPLSSTRPLKSLRTLIYCNTLKKGKWIFFFSLKDTTWKELYKIKDKLERPFYIMHLEELKKDEQLKLLELARSCPIVLSYTHKEPLEFPKIVSIECGNKPLSLFNNHTTFLSIQEYEREAIRHFSSVCTDTELANKLGISRKSLWEKRRKYNLPRK